MACETEASVASRCMRSMEECRFPVSRGDYTERERGGGGEDIRTVQTW